MSDLKEISFDKQDLIELKLTLDTFDGGSHFVIQRATNDALTGVRTTSVNEISGKVTLTKTVIRKYFKVNKMSSSDLSADIECKSEPIPLILYSARSVLKGVSAKLLNSQKRSIIPHAFIAVMGSGHKGVFWRKDNRRGTRWKTGKRMRLPSPEKRHPAVAKEGLEKFQLPIKELYGPRVPDIFDDSDIMEPVLKDASKRFDDRLKHHTDLLFQKARG